MAEQEEQEHARIPPPLRLRTAYAFFVSDTFHQVAQEMETSQPQRVISRLGELWRMMTTQEKEPFIRREEDDRTRYQQAKVEWLRQHDGRPVGNMNRKRKDSKDPNTRRRPASAYIIFKREMGKQVRDEMPEATGKERQSEVNRRWRELDNDTRDMYKMITKEDKVRSTGLSDGDREQERQRQRIIQLLEMALQVHDPPGAQAPAPVVVPADQTAPVQPPAADQPAVQAPPAPEP